MSSHFINILTPPTLKLKRYAFMKVTNGIELLNEIEGSGSSAKKGDRVIFNLKVFLHHGDEVLVDEAQSKDLPNHMMREEGGCIFVDRTITLGKRQVIAGIDYSLIGMKEGGYRKIKVSPHLAYREQGIPGLIPENALLVIELWLRSIVANE